MVAHALVPGLDQVSSMVQGKWRSEEGRLGIGLISAGLMKRIKLKMISRVRKEGLKGRREMDKVGTPDGLLSLPGPRPSLARLQRHMAQSAAR